MAAPATRATLDDLMRHDGKAELIGGRIVAQMATGRVPNRVAGRIYRSLAAHADGSGVGEAFTDNVGFAVPELANGRESFSPDASYYGGPRTDDMGFIEDAPTFAVEVRSENDYGPAADREYAAKRDDYFEAGTLVVWDVDTISETVTRYRLDEEPVTFRRGDIANAEPAVPGWTMPVDDIFRSRRP